MDRERRLIAYAPSGPSNFSRLYCNRWRNPKIMAEQHDHYVNARNLAVDILRKEAKRTPEIVQEVAAKAAQAATIFAPGVSIDVETLSAELKHLFSIAVDQATALDDLTEHVPWLQNKKAQIQWRFWNRYMTYLERDFGMPP